MKPEEFILDVKHNTLKSYYVFSGDNKYVIDKYIGFALKKDRWEVVSPAMAYYELSNRSLLVDKDNFVVCRIDNGEVGRKQFQSIISLQSKKTVLILSTKQINVDNEIYFSTTAGMNQAEEYCRKNGIKDFPVKESVEEFGLYKTMLELEKIFILQQQRVDFILDDILALSEKYGGELKVLDLDFSEFIDFEEYPMSVKIEKDILTMIRIREIIDKNVSDISRISGIQNEKMIYLFKKYAVKYSLEELLELYNYVDDLRVWLRLGMKEGYFRDFLMLKLTEIHRRR